MLYSQKVPGLDWQVLVMLVTLVMLTRSSLKSFSSLRCLLNQITVKEQTKA